MANIKEMTIESLKALAFDEVIKRDVSVNNIQIIQAELKLREATPTTKNITDGEQV